MTDPFTQILTRSIAFAQQTPIATAIALGLGGWWAYALYRRVVDSADPSIRKWGSSALGSSSMLISGAYVSALVAFAITVVTWPAPLETPLLGALLVGGVAFHSALEYREDKT